MDERNISGHGVDYRSHDYDTHTHDHNIIIQAVSAISAASPPSLYSALPRHKTMVSRTTILAFTSGVSVSRFYLSFIFVA